MRSLLLVLFAGVVAAAATACTEPDLDGAAEFEDLTATGEGATEEVKADRTDLAMSPLALAVPASLGTGEIRLVIRTNAEYRALFGAGAPAVDFSRRWVAFYSAGRRPTGGYQASIDRLWTSVSGKTLRIATALHAPGRDCVVTQAVTVPHAAVAFERPRVRPTLFEAFHTSDVRPCAAACRAIAPTELGRLDLTVTRRVRAVFFVPSDRWFRDCLAERLDTFAGLARDFYRDELAANGHLGADGAGRTFALDTAADGRWNVVYVVGEHDAAWYQAQPDPPGAAMAEMFARLPAAYHQRNVTLYIYDLAVVEGRRILYSGNGGSGAPWEGEGTGYVLQGAHFLGVGFDTVATTPAQQAAMFGQAGDAGVDDWNGDQAFGPLTRGQYTSTYLGAALHELGHAFYLDHVFTDYDGDGIETNLMGNGFRRLSGRYLATGYRPATALGAEQAAVLSAAWMFQR